MIHIFVLLSSGFLNTIISFATTLHFINSRVGDDILVVAEKISAIFFRMKEVVVVHLVAVRHGTLRSVNA